MSFRSRTGARIELGLGVGGVNSKIGTGANPGIGAALRMVCNWNPLPAANIKS